MRTNKTILTVALSVAAGITSCTPRKTRVQAPPAAPPPVQATREPALIEPPRISPKPTADNTDLPDVPATEALSPATTTPPPPQPPANRSRNRRAAKAPATAPATDAGPRVAEAKPLPETKPPVEVKPPAEVKPATPEPTLESQPTPAVQLQEALPANVREELTQGLNRNINESRQFLARIGTRSLTQTQSETVARIRGFVKEALDIQPTDIRVASQLAERAVLLTRELAKTIN